ncbi:MAG: flagellar transcriptional regulator FlhD [Zoogloeaceae bacterium]|nr:flagellar transcriptional regulator FlhD [Zoogloeaceae bacterium]
MNGPSVQSEIQEINLAYLMLAQRMLREDRESAMYRLGVGGDVADLVLGLSATQLVTVASNQMVVPRFRFEDKQILGLLAGTGRDEATSRLHAAILATARTPENRV